MDRFLVMYWSRVSVRGGLQALCAVAILAVSGCEYETPANSDQNPASGVREIGQQEFDQVQIGDRESRILKRLGPPDNRQSRTTETGTSSCVYYDQDDGPDRFQICFADHRVRSKGAY